MTKFEEYLDTLPGEWAVWRMGPGDYSASYSPTPSTCVMLGEYTGPYNAEGETMAECLDKLARNIREGVVTQ